MKTFDFLTSIFSTCSAVRDLDSPGTPGDLRAGSLNRSMLEIRRPLVVLAISLACASAPASTIIWTGSNGGGSNTNWNNTANWSGGVVPGSTDVAEFSSPSNGAGAAKSVIPNVNVNSTIGELTFSASGNTPYTLSSSAGVTLQIDGVTISGTVTGIATSASMTSGTTISAALKLGNSQSWINSPTTPGNTFTVSGTVDTNGKTLTLDGTGTFGAISNIISNSGGITKQGTGTWTLQGANTYSGATTVSSGNLTVSGSGKLGTGALNVAAGATLNLNNASVTSSVGNLSGQGTISFGASHTLSIAQTSAQNFTGSITGSGAVTLNSGSSAALTLSSGTFSYSGGTTISGGILKVNGSLSSSSNAVMINSGGTLAGTGSVAGAVTLNSGGFISPGDNSASTLTLGSLTWNSGGVITTTLGTTSDKVITTGAFTKGTGSTFTFDFGNSNVSAGQTYTVATVGSFANWGAANSDFTFQPGGTITGGSFSFNGNNLDFLVTSAIPEPSTYAAVFGAAALAVAVYRRRQVRAAATRAV